MNPDHMASEKPADLNSHCFQQMSGFTLFSKYSKK